MCSLLRARHEDAPDESQEIEPLPPNESLELLRAWAGRYAADDTAANEIVRLLGGLPLALFLAGRYLAQRKQQAGEFAAWLQEQGLAALHFGERPRKSIPLLMQTSLAQVGEIARAAFGVAGLLAISPFRAQIIAASPENNTCRCQSRLGELVDYGLFLRPDDYFQVTHALAHSYARTEAAPGIAVVNRLAIYYVAWAKAKGANGRLAGYAVLDRHRAHIMAVQFAALSARQWDAVQKITASLSDYLDAKGYWTERITLVQAGLDAARASMDRHDECAFLREVGRCLLSPRRTPPRHRTIRTTSANCA